MTSKAAIASANTPVVIQKNVIFRKFHQLFQVMYIRKTLEKRAKPRDKAPCRKNSAK
jgi:hypothetical protein